MTEEIKQIDGGGYTRTCTCSCGENKTVTYVIPVGGTSNKKWWQFWKKEDILSKEKVEKSLKELMDRYKEDIVFDEKTGEISIPDYFLPIKNNIQL